MGPKVRAACEFVERGGEFAAIGSIDKAATLLAGTAGTCVMPTLTELAAASARGEGKKR
jgi:carbamate kinase